MPSIVSTADGFHSSSPVVSVKVSASKISSCGSRPCSSQADLVDALGDLELALARLGHPDLVDGQRDQRGAVLERRSGRRESILSRPASRLTELTIARPGIWSSAVAITSGSVESIWIGAGWVSETFLAVIAHLLVLVLALGERDAEVEHVRAALDLVLGDLHEAVVVVGEQQLLGLARALRVDALADERRRAAPARAARRRSSIDTRGGRGAGRSEDGRPSHARRRSRGCARASCRSSRRRC